MEKVSFLMPFYNNSQFIESAIESVRNIDYPNLEFILVDDGSLDRSTEIVKKYVEKDNRVKLYSHNTNLGPAQALKTCINKSTGNILIFSAADDISYKDRAKRIVAEFQDNNNLGIVISNADIINSNSELTSEQYNISQNIKNTNIALAQFKRNFCLGATMAIRKVPDILFSPDVLNEIDDYDLSLQYILAGYEISIVRKSLIQYRLHENNVSNNREQLYQKTVNALHKYSSREIEAELGRRQFENDQIKVALGVFELFRERISSATKFFLEALEITNNISLQIEVYFYLSICAYKTNKKEKSYLYLLKAHNLNPNEYTILNNLAVLEVKIYNNHKEAISYLEKIIEQEPNYIDALNNFNKLIDKCGSDLKITERLLENKLMVRKQYEVL